MPSSPLSAIIQRRVPCVEEMGYQLRNMPPNTRTRAATEPHSIVFFFLSFLCTSRWAKTQQIETCPNVFPFIKGKRPINRPLLTPSSRWSTAPFYWVKECWSVRDFFRPGWAEHYYQQPDLKWNDVKLPRTTATCPLAMWYACYSLDIHSTLSLFLDMHVTDPFNL